MSQDLGKSNAETNRSKKQMISATYKQLDYHEYHPPPLLPVTPLPQTKLVCLTIFVYR